MAKLAKSRVLVIDDERGPRESLRILLKTQYDVICASSVDEGVKLFQEMSPDVVIMDIKMPGRSGIEGLGDIRKLDEDVSVIMLTGFGALDTAREALRLGANDYLKKPFEIGEMLEAIQRYTERTRVKRKHREASKEVNNLNRTLVKELQAMEHMASVGEASAEFVHDLRNPLTIVLGYVHLLSDRLDKAQSEMGTQYDDVCKYLDVIQDNLNRCHSLAQMWQKMSRDDGDKRQPVDVKSILEEVQAGTGFLAMQDDHLKINYDVQLDGVNVLGSRTQLLRALHNVISNAVHAMPESGGEIRVLSQTTDEEVIIEVRDNGCGIDPEVLPKIFERYFTTKDEGQGTGLGLAITKKIVEQCNGTVDVESQKGEGTVVRLRLPAC